MAFSFGCAHGAGGPSFGPVVPRAARGWVSEAGPDLRPQYRRRQRLGSAAIEEVLAKGKRLRTGPITAQFRANGLRLARLGLIIPKRQVPLAVDRNRIKRLLREWFRHRQGRLGGRDLVVRLVAPLKAPELAIQDMERFFSQL